MCVVSEIASFSLCLGGFFLCENKLLTWLCPPPTDKRALPSWRYAVRQSALPLIRAETPYLAWMQDKLRTPALDSYFAITANLGTHTFFMVGLPILFWCGYPAFGKGYVSPMPSLEEGFDCNCG